jgi:hypothetical protein
MDMKKFNRFDTLLETAFTHFSNGGFREGSPVKIKKGFFNSSYFKKHYSGSVAFCEWLKSMVDQDYFFFIKRVVGGGSEQNIKDANTNEGSGDVFLVLKCDPRSVHTPTEMSEFTVPGDFELIEVLDFGINLPPVQGVRNKYEKPIGTKPEVVQININLGNQPEDNSLPTKNVNISK